MPELSETHSKPISHPDYVGLIKFLVNPFLEVPEALRVDCEISAGKAKVWVRLAFESSDKGRVFGRGGRNIQAIRTVLEATARQVGYSAYLDVYGGAPQGRQNDHDRQDDGDQPNTRPSSSPKGSPRLRSR